MTFEVDLSCAAYHPNICPDYVYQQFFPFYHWIVFYGVEVPQLDQSPISGFSCEHLCVGAVNERLHLYDVNVGGVHVVLYD